MPGGGDGSRTAARLCEPPLTLYIHLPWCVRKCPYCDFNSHAVQDALPESGYIDALLADLECMAVTAAGRVATSLYFGGGTPSLFRPASIARFLTVVVERKLLASDAEVSMEANPGTIERGLFAEYADAGVNRFSLGAQSFDPVQLERLGRIHSDGEIYSSINELKAAGIKNFNLDLMFGLPGQTVPAAVEDLRLAIDARPAHLSHYQLTIEPNTLFHSRRPILPDDDLTWDMQAACQQMITAAGLAQYEVSAFARPGAECRHNVNYWRYGDYLGLGAGAHSKMTDIARGSISRHIRPRHPTDYMKLAGSPRRQWQAVGEADRVFEFMLNALRLTEGFQEKVFERRTGISAEVVSARLRALTERGLMAEGPPGCWCASPTGLRFLNDLQATFLP